MDKLIVMVLVALFATNVSYSQNEGKTEDLKREIQKVSDTQINILNELEKLRNDSKAQTNQINELQSTERTLESNWIV